MRAGRNQLINRVRLLSRHTALALAATILATIICHWRALNIVLVSQQDNGVFLRDDILVAHLAQLVIDNFRPTLVAELLFHLSQFCLDNVQNLLLIG